MALLFRKALQDDEARERLYEAVERGDAFDIQTAMQSMDPLPQRLPVDLNIFAMPAPPRDLQLLALAAPPESVTQELDFLASLVPLRDTPLAELPAALPEPYRVVSWFLRDYRLRPFVPRDYVTTPEVFEAVQRGDAAPKPERLAESRAIATGRDFAAYVHDDDPLALWSAVAAELLRLGCPKRRATEVTLQTDFACVGPPWIAGTLGEALRRCGAISFRLKWSRRVARPEEQYHRERGDYLPQCFPEGSPVHPSSPAMHAAAAWTLCFVVLELFDATFGLPSGRTVEQECQLLAGNVAEARCWAGVHYPSDNAVFVPLARRLARLVVNDALRGR
jgi:hypothetical protein